MVTKTRVLVTLGYLCLKLCCDILFQKRFEQQKPSATATTSLTTNTTPTSTPTTSVSTGQKTGQVTPGTKMVLASKLGSPVSFQQDKNFHQSFASWVKQGQTNNSSGEQVDDKKNLKLILIPSENLKSHRRAPARFVHFHPSHSPEMGRKISEVFGQSHF